MKDRFFTKSLEPLVDPSVLSFKVLSKSDPLLLIENIANFLLFNGDSSIERQVLAQWVLGSSATKKKFRIFSTNLL